MLEEVLLDLAHLALEVEVEQVALEHLEVELVQWVEQDLVTQLQEHL
jgi:hypothetical protein